MDPITLIAAATAGFIIGQGAHQQDGFRDTGCDPAHQTAVISERTGKVLYWSNPTCPAGSGGSDLAGGVPSETVPAAPNAGSNGSNGGKGDASLNSGQDRTGRGDNDKGRGRNRP